MSRSPTVVTLWTAAWGENADRVAWLAGRFDQTATDAWTAVAVFSLVLLLVPVLPRPRGWTGCSASRRRWGRPGSAS
jgi:hypothetical protein